MNAMFFDKGIFHVLQGTLHRLTTGIVDWTCMFVFVKLIGLNDVIIKFAANILVIVLNYAASKRIIFKRRKKL